MILIDHEIKQRHKEIFLEGYDESNVTSVSYDLRIDSIVEEDSFQTKYSLRPNEIVFIKTKEMIKMPNDLIGRIGEKNSRLRQGLSVKGPHYQPGHRTFIYLLVQNISSKSITIKKGDEIAQIFFEQLSSTPTMTYNMQRDASFNNEEEFQGFGKYKDEYEKRMNKINDANKDLDKKVNNLYANVLTIMGLFVSIFSLIMVNFTNISQNHLIKEFLIPMNLSLGVVISLFVGLILIFVNQAKEKGFLLFYIILMIALILGLILFL